MKHSLIDDSSSEIVGTSSPDSSSARLPGAATRNNKRKPYWLKAAAAISW
jgi:hypothetical protein